MKNYQKILLSSFFLLGLLLANLVYAGFQTGPIVPCGTGQDPESCTLCHLWELADNIINFISFNLAIPIATLLFISAGAIYIFSGGIDSRLTLARTIFTNTVIGLVIIFCSWLLVDTLVKTIATGEIIGAWNKFPICVPG